MTLPLRLVRGRELICVLREKLFHYIPVLPCLVTSIDGMGRDIRSIIIMLTFYLA